VELTPVDEWIISEFQSVTAAVTLAMETYRFDLAAKAIYEFVWDEFCDWYLELSKPILNDADTPAAMRRGTRQTLAQTLEATLRLSHPFLPFLTEELWQQLPVCVRTDSETIMTQPYPVANDDLISAEAQADVAWLKKVVSAVRNIRGEMDISPAKEIPVMFANGSAEDRTRIEKFDLLLKSLIRPEQLIWLEPEDEKPLAATGLVDEMELLVPMAGLIDKEAELARLDKDLEKKSKDKERTAGKLGNPNFVDKAPADVVQKERDKLAELESAIEKLQQQRDSVASM